MKVETKPLINRHFENYRILLTFWGEDSTLYQHADKSGHSVSLSKKTALRIAKEILEAFKE